MELTDLSEAQYNGIPHATPHHPHTIPTPSLVPRSMWGYNCIAASRLCLLTYPTLPHTIPTPRSFLARCGATIASPLRGLVGWHTPRHRSWPHIERCLANLWCISIEAAKRRCNCSPTSSEARAMVWGNVDSLISRPRRGRAIREFRARGYGIDGPLRGPV